MKIGVLGLQGDVREHVRALEAAGATALVVKHPSDVDDVDAVVLPGGESTMIGLLLHRYGLLEPLRARVDAGMPAYGTCAGMILLARDVVGEDDAPHRIPSLALTVRRNAYGRQVDSFETDLAVAGLDEPFRAVFIRAPIVEDVGDGVDVLAEADERPVLVRQGRLLASSFHPEMTGDARLHEMFVSVAGG